MSKTRKKRKRKPSSKGKGGGGGGVMVSMRSGFANVAKRATGGGAKKPATAQSKTINTVITVALLAVAAYLLLRRFGYL